MGAPITHRRPKEHPRIRDFVHERFSRLDAKLDLIPRAQETTNRRLSSLEARVTGVEASVVHVQERLDGIQAQLDEMGSRLDPTDTPPAAG
jgi:hypothetical protein